MRNLSIVGFVLSGILQVRGQNVWAGMALIFASSTLIALALRNLIDAQQKKRSKEVESATTGNPKASAPRSEGS